jgi:hypothetical protein
MKHAWNEDILRRSGFTQGADGSWRKGGVEHHHPAGAADAQPNAEQASHGPSPLAEPTVSRFLAIITIRTVRPRDCDGLTAKSYIDAITHGGCHWPDDSPEHLEVVFLPEKVRHFAEEETKIEIYELT